MDILPLMVKIPIFMFSWVPGLSTQVPTGIALNLCLVLSRPSPAAKKVTKLPSNDTSSRRRFLFLLPVIPRVLVPSFLCFELACLRLKSKRLRSRQPQPEAD